MYCQTEIYTNPSTCAEDLVTIVFFAELQLKLLQESLLGLCVTWFLIKRIEMMYF